MKVSLIITTVILSICIAIQLLITWLGLIMWNWICESAKLALTIPVNFGTVIGITVLICILTSIFRKECN